MPKKPEAPKPDLAKLVSKLDKKNADQKLVNSELQKKNNELTKSYESLITSNKQLQANLDTQQQQHELQNAEILKGITLGVTEIAKMINEETSG